MSRLSTGGDCITSEAREHCLAEMAEKLHIQQAAVSKLERRADMFLSTLRS